MPKTLLTNQPAAAHRISAEFYWLGQPGTTPSPPRPVERAPIGRLALRGAL